MIQLGMMLGDHGGFPFMDGGSLMAGLESLALDMP
jgi:hypothetical protein